MQTFDHPQLMNITPRPAAIMARGAASMLWDEAGRAYLDFLQGWAVNSLGHCPPEVTQALTSQAQTLITPSPALHNRPQMQLAELLCRQTKMASAHFCNSGAEANEAAIKLARRWGRKHKDGAFTIVSTDNAFHGRTLATMAASGKPGWEVMFPPKPDGFIKVPYADLDAMRQRIDADVVAIMVEPIQGEGGVVVPPSGYLQALRALCDEFDLLLICDEIQTGVGRTGTYLACEHEGVAADIVTLGKGLGGGIPIGAVLANERVGQFDYGEQGGTFNGNPLVTAVAATVHGLIAQPQFLNEVTRLGTRLQNCLTRLGQTYGALEVRGRGLLWAMVLPSDVANQVVEAAFDAGLLINAARPNVLRFMPSLRVQDAELDEFASRLAHALDSTLSDRVVAEVDRAWRECS